jgi:glycosyltransferase involved in cell wall biosynthesis
MINEINKPASVAVVMCTYNGSKFLDEQIDSILNQDYKTIELIIVDDNSADDTWQKLQGWQQKTDRIKIYRNESNLGYNKNFERAILLASADFIAISDQDDIWLPQKVSKLLSAFKDNETVLAHNRSVRLENGRLRFKSAKLHYHFEGNDTRRLFMFNQVNGHDMMFRKDLVNKFVPIPSGMMYDWWIAVTATCHGSIASVNEFLVYHRIHSENSFFNKNAPSKKKELDLEDSLKLFVSMKELKGDAKSYLTEFLGHVTRHDKQQKAFDFKFFLFLYKNRKIVFGHKKRLFSDLAYFKYAIKYARMNFKNKGVSF